MKQFIKLHTYEKTSSEEIEIQSPKISFYFKKTKQLFKNEKDQITENDNFSKNNLKTNSKF